MYSGSAVNSVISASPCNARAGGLFFEYIRYVHDTLWLSDDAFLAITNNHTLMKVDLQLDAVVFARTVL